ncbi:MAG: outer membrane beta-barrel protein [Alphaproteobacteria bacterium]|nr:outer membrane beta-barrel protein [Alphaproteobacteria bacterium]
MLKCKRHVALLVGACSLPWTSTAAWAAAAEPVSVGDRFNQMHLAPGFSVEGWEVRPTAELRSGYDDNITWASVDAASSAALSLRGSIDASQQAGPYALGVSAMLRQTWYPEASANDRTEGTLRASISADLGPQLVLKGAISAEAGVETGITNGIVVDGVFDPYTKKAVFKRLPVEAEVDYSLGRIGLRGDARLEAVHYDDQTTRSGLRVSQAFRNGYEGEVGLRGSYEFYPNLGAFVDLREGARRYEDSNGDSDTWRAVIGGTVELTHLLVGEAYVGYAGQSFSNGGESSGLSYGAQLHWFARNLLSFSLNASREFRAEVDTTAGTTSAVAVTHDFVNLRAEWEPLRQMLVYAQAGFEQEERQSVNRRDELVSLILGATYALTGNLNLELEYEHEDGTSNFSGDFERNSLMIGVTARY